MPRKTKSNRSKRSKKQKMVNMVGCSKMRKTRRGRHLAKKICPKCRCGSPCRCSKPCPCDCHLKTLRGGSGCGSCGCPIGGLTWKQMNKFGGSKEQFFPLNSVPKDTPPLKYGPILGASGQIGGTCGMCAATSVVPTQNGGSNFYKPPSLVPGPIVGSPWGTQLSQWPGVDGVGGDRNYFKPYNLNDDPALQMTYNDAGYNTAYSKVGGKKHKKRGGGIVPQDLTNLGNNITYNFKSAYNALNGYKAPTNPAPYMDQGLNSKYNMLK